MKQTTSKGTGVIMKRATQLLGGLLLAASPWLCWAADEELIKKGEYLATASDCIACHTAPNGQYFAGGLAFDTPYGTMYSPNITPDKKFGIGNYSSDQFNAALTKGIRGDGAKLYPAMPYTSYHYITRQDSDAMYAYFMSLNPVPQKNTKNDLKFPFNIRAVLIFWDWLFLDSGKFVEDPNQSSQWNRGKYLAEGPGHCGECHTPRNKLFFNMEHDKDLQGFMLGTLIATNITENVLVQKGWKEDSLVNFFKYASSRRGSAFGPMSEVVFHSTQHLTEDDLSAVANYLLNSNILTPNLPVPAAVKPQMASANDLKGQSLYFGNCAGCHGDAGQGVPHVAPALYGNSTVASQNPHNLITVILNGISTHRFSPTNAFYAMPHFKDTLTDEEIVQLVNFLRMGWSGMARPITTEDIKAIRKKVADATH